MRVPRRPTTPPSLAYAVIHLDRPTVDVDVGVVQEPVEQADGGGVFGQEPAPGFEGPVGGDSQGAAFVGGGDEPEQQLGAGRRVGRPQRAIMLRGVWPVTARSASQEGADQGP